ncbi:MAG: UDP-N-acetylmuramate dehydrogenase [Chloroflexi bacterium]|nr:UDP-N-acetylmuramate dehydrogenase [Chloroflexota bacterium]
MLATFAHEWPQKLLDELAQFGRYGLQFNQPLAPYTSFRIGGPAEMLLTLHRIENLINALDLLHRHRAPFLILGGGSNVLIRDEGVAGLVLLNQCREVRWPEGAPPLVRAESGAPLAQLARASLGRGLAGLEWAVSVPGTVGGAVVGNAGAHGQCTADSLRRIRLWRNGEVVEMAAHELAFDYRTSMLKRRLAGSSRPWVVLEALFQLQPDPTREAQKRAEAYIAHRRRTQPVNKSAGSIFKNPPGDYAGRLIEAAGLKGLTIGGACVSKKHANFIINLGDATAADVLALMTRIQEEVLRRFGVRLEPEIQII